MFRGGIWLSYGQMYLESSGLSFEDSGDLDLAFAGQVNGLCGAAVTGRLWLITGMHTGTVPCTVELHDVPPQVGAQWDDVVEASYQPAERPIFLIGCTGTTAADLALEPGLEYRVRYCVSGMDAGGEAEPREEDEPEIDRFLLQFWPAPPRPDVVVRQTSEVAVYWHGLARNLPSLAEVTSARAEAAAAHAAAAALAAADQRERMRLQGEFRRWNGRRPVGRVADVPEGPRLAELDRPLLDALADAPDGLLRRVAHRAAWRALTEAGMAEVDWIAAGLAAIESGFPLPEPFGDDAGVWQALGVDQRIPVTVVPSPDGRADNWSQQYMSMPALLAAADPDPLRAAIAGVVHASVGVGFDRRDALLAETGDLLAAYRA